MGWVSVPSVMLRAFRNKSDALVEKDQPSQWVPSGLRICWSNLAGVELAIVV